MPDLEPRVWIITGSIDTPILDVAILLAWTCATRDADNWQAAARSPSLKSTNRWKVPGVIRVVWTWYLRKRPSLVLLTRNVRNVGGQDPARLVRTRSLDVRKRDGSDRIFPPHLFVCVSLGSRQRGSTTISEPSLREAGHCHTAESGTAMREVWSLSPTGFYSRSSQPAEFGCGLSQTDISRLSCE